MCNDHSVLFCKPQSTLLSADPVPVNIFVDVVILGDAIHLTVSLSQVYMNGSMSHPLHLVKIGFTLIFTRSHMESGSLHMLPFVYHCHSVWYAMSTNLPHFLFLC